MPAPVGREEREDDMLCCDVLIILIDLMAGAL